ncbi:hypothetical protein KDK77_06570 [bacterium]|nr:hypothetical protein [bacterium]
MAQFVSPQIPEQIIDLELGIPGIIETIRQFLAGEFDPDAEQLDNFIQLRRANDRTSTDELRRAILASQGAQGIRGGAAGKQLNQQLSEKIRQDLEREQAFLLDALDRVVENRMFGVTAGQNSVNAARNYALDRSQSENVFNLGQAQLRASRQNSNRSLGDLLIGGASQAISGITGLFSKLF